MTAPRRSSSPTRAALSARASDGVRGQRVARPARRAGDVAFAVAAGTVLTWYNNVAGRTSWHRRWYLAVNAGAAAIALAAAAASGLTADELGLRRARLRAGLRLGAMASAPIAAAFALAPVTPARRLLHDQRVAGLDRRQLAYQVLLRIPVGTVGWEEIAFRAVLPAALHRVLPRRAEGDRGGTHRQPARNRAERQGRGGRRRRGWHLGGGRLPVLPVRKLGQPSRAGHRPPDGQLRRAARQRRELAPRAPPRRPVKLECPQRDSNPCCRLERAVS